MPRESCKSCLRDISFLVCEVLTGAFVQMGCDERAAHKFLFWPFKRRKIRMEGNWPVYSREDLFLCGY